MGKPTDLVQDTLDLLILKTIALQPMDGWGIAQRIRQVLKECLKLALMLESIQRRASY